MVAQRTVHRPISKNAAAKHEALVKGMAERIIRRDGYWLVPSSSCPDPRPTTLNVKNWYIVRNGYCECRSAKNVPNAEDRSGEPCIHQEAAARWRDQEVYAYHNFEQVIAAS
jgi:hypothetical protein